MASAVIHLAVAKSLIKYLNIKNEKDYFLGAIAPDIAKQIGEKKNKSHFIIDTPNDVPNIDKFINKYPYFEDKDFDLGYFIHLYTDKIWYDEFMRTRENNNYVRLMDGTIIKITPEELSKMIYQDYTNLNVVLLDEYKMDLSLFYEEFVIPDTDIEEIPKEKLNILIDKMGIIIENSKNNPPYTFDLYDTLQFIDEATQKILRFLNEYEKETI